MAKRQTWDKRMSDYELWINGEEVIVEPSTTFWFTCCDCSLSHLLLFRLTEDGKIGVRIYRDDDKTNKYRAKYKKAERREIVETFGGELK